MLSNPITEIIDRLTERQLLVFSLRYGLNTNGITLTTQEIANLTQVSYKRICTLHDQTAGKLNTRNVKKYLKNYEHALAK
jgi:DNA-directed RNA polymerase sigma subunit (sigma70/sigma32)